MLPLIVGSVGVGLLAQGMSTQARLARIEQEQARSRRGLGAGIAAQHAVVGFTAPTDIYEVMRRVETSAQALNVDVVANVSDNAFKTAWAAWFADWRRFFDANYRTLGAVLHTDELKAQTEAFRLQLLSWYDGYQKQRTPAGAPVPPATGVPPVAPPPETETQGGSGGSIFPWWAWVLGGVGLVGVGYLGYRYYQEAQAKRRVLEHKVLPRLIGADLAEAASARDPDERPGGYADARRDGYRFPAETTRDVHPFAGGRRLETGGSSKRERERDNPLRMDYYTSRAPARDPGHERAYDHGERDPWNGDR